MLKITILAILGALAVGCAPALPPIPYNPTAQLLTPTGKVGYTIYCTNEGECMQWAGYKCQGPYAILSKELHTASMTSAGGWGAGWQFSRNQETHLHMVVECAEPNHIRPTAYNPDSIE